MKRNLIVLVLLFVNLTICFSKPILRKHRDKVRLNGYDVVDERAVGTIDSYTGQFVVHRIDLYCSSPGDRKCQKGYAIEGGSEFDNITDMTSSERLKAQTLVNLGDERINNGEASGIISEVYTFVNIETGQSYQRTFTYTWTTNENGEVFSEFNLGDKIILE